MRGWGECMAIPVDDILEVYGRLPEEKKQAVSNLIGADWYVVVETHNGNDDRPVFTIDWKAGSDLSIYILTMLYKAGKKGFGEVWAEELLETLQTE